MATKKKKKCQKYQKINSDIFSSWKFEELFLILASTEKYFLLPLLKHFGCYGNFKFP